jgi:hypothetical protein
MSNSGKQKNAFLILIARIITNGFIVFHLIAFTSWSMPSNSPIRTELVRWITPYMHWTGLWQSWAMFAPDPIQINAYLEALITFRDGTHSTWTFPRMDKLGYFDRYIQERYRKWSSDYVRLDAYSFIWADTARYIARRHNHPMNPPVEIKLKRYWMEIPPPQTSSTYQPWYKEYPPDHSYIFFIYLPRQEDFS